MATTLFGDKTEEREATTLFGDAAVTPDSTGPTTATVSTEVATDRAGQIYDTATEDGISLQEADKFFYSTANQQRPTSNDFFRDPPPDNRVGFSEEWKNQWTGSGLVTKVPIAGGVMGGLESLDLIWAANRLSDAGFDYDQFNRKEDAYSVSVGSGMLQQQRTMSQLRGPSSRSRDGDMKQVAAAIKEFSKERNFYGKVAAGVSQLPTWMIEFAATGGFASIGDDVAKKAGEKMLRNYVKTTAGKIAIRTGRLATGAVVRTSTGLLPRVSEKAINRQALIEIGVAEQEGWATSLAKAWGDVAIESFSEETGGLLTKGAGKLLDKLPFGKRFMTTLQSRWVDAGFGTADDFVTKALTKAGYSNILAEMGEERIGTLLREATGVSDRKGGFGERIWAGIQEDFTLENMGVELVTLLVPGTVKAGMTVGQSLTRGVDVPTEAEQLDMAVKVGKVGFDSPEDAQAYAERAAEVAQREGKDVTISTDLADNSVTILRTEVTDAGEEVLRPEQGEPVTPEFLQEHGGQASKRILLFESDKNEKLSKEQNDAVMSFLQERIDTKKDDVDFNPTDIIRATSDDEIQKVIEVTKVKAFRGGTAGQAPSVKTASSTAQFGSGVYFGPEGVAEDFATERPNGEVQEFDIDTSNFFDERTAELDTPDGRKVADALIEAGAGKEFVEANFGGVGSLSFIAKVLGRGEKNFFPGGEKIKQAILDAGFDGVVSEFQGAEQYVSYIDEAFTPSQAIEAKPPVAREVPPSVQDKQKQPPTQSVTAEQKADMGGDPIDKVREALKQGKKVIPKIKAEQTAERKKRVGAAAGAKSSAIKKGTPTEEAIFRSTGLLKGQLTDYQQRYESIEDQLTTEERNALYSKIDNHPDLQYFEILNTATSLKKLLGGVAITDGDVKNIKRVFGESFVDETGKDLLEDRQEVSSLYDRVVTLWKAGLLTGIKTTNLNTLSNLSHSMTETAKDIPAALVDKTAALFTGKRTLAFTTKGTKEGVVKGLKDGWKYLKTGHSERDIGKKLDYTKVNFGTGKLAKGLQAYEETIFHLLGAEDQPFYYGAKARSIASQAIAQGKTMGLKGKALDKHVDSLIENPTDDMIVASVHDAEMAVFQNRTALGDVAKKVQQMPIGEIVVPFGRTPSAVATQIVNYTPVGAIAETAKQIKRGEFNQRQFSQAVGRSVVGTGVLFVGSELFKAGLLTLDFPEDEKERKLYELEGRKPNSIKIGGKWRSVQTLGPAGNVLVIGGHFANQLNKEGSPSMAINVAVKKSVKSFTEQTFTTGIKKFVEVWTEPERGADEWFESMAGSLVPTIVADIARASMDTEVRQDGAIQRIQSRIPGLRGKLPSKVDVFGQDLPRYGGNVIEVMLDPSRPVKIRNDVVVDELRRLADKDIRVTPTLLGGKDGFDILTDEENTAMWKFNGDLVYRSLQSLITSRAYPLLSSDFERKKRIEQVVTITRKAARYKTIAIKLRQGFPIEEIIESGLLASSETLEMMEMVGGK